MNFFCIALFACLTMVSCSKEDSITETDKEVALEATYEINNRSITTNAYAGYCMDNGKEVLTVSNNQSLLSGIPFNMEDLEINDFVFTYVVEDDESYAIGGSVFGEDLGFLTEQQLFQVGPDYEVSSNDGEVVSGDFSGTFLGFDDDGELFAFPYSISFNAEIVEVSTFCD